MDGCYPALGAAASISFQCGAGDGDDGVDGDSVSQFVVFSVVLQILIHPLALTG